MHCLNLNSFSTEHTRLRISEAINDASDLGNFQGLTPPVTQPKHPLNDLIFQQAKLDKATGTITLEGGTTHNLRSTPEARQVNKITANAVCQTKLKIAGTIGTIVAIPLLVISALFGGLYVAIIAGAVCTIAAVALIAIRRNLARTNIRHLDELANTTKNEVIKKAQTLLDGLKSKKQKVIYDSLLAQAVIEGNKKAAEQKEEEADKGMRRKEIVASLAVATTKSPSRALAISDDCLMNVFTFLSLIDFNSCTRVCRAFFLTTAPTPRGERTFSHYYVTKRRLANLEKLSKIPAPQHRLITAWEPRQTDFSQVTFMTSKCVGIEKGFAWEPEQQIIPLAGTAHPTEPIRDRLFIGHHGNQAFYADSDNTEQRNFYIIDTDTMEERIIPINLPPDHDPVEHSLFRCAKLLNANTIVLCGGEVGLAIYDFSKTPAQITRRIDLRDHLPYRTDEFMYSRPENLHTATNKDGMYMLGIVSGAICVYYTKQNGMYSLFGAFDQSTLKMIPQEDLPAESIMCSGTAQSDTYLQNITFRDGSNYDSNLPLQIFDRISKDHPPIYQREIRPDFVATLQGDLLHLGIRNYSEFRRNHEIIYLPTKHSFSFNHLHREDYNEVISRSARVFFSADCTKMAYLIGGGKLYYVDSNPAVEAEAESKAEAAS